MSMNDLEEQDDEPLDQRRGCPMGIPMDLLRKMSPEDIEEWFRIDWQTSPAKDSSRPPSVPSSSTD